MREESAETKIGAVTGVETTKLIKDIVEVVLYKEKFGAVLVMS